MVSADSSTLILLAKAELLDAFLGSLNKQLSITATVHKEAIAKKDALDAKLIEQRIKEAKIIIKHLKEKEAALRLAKDFNIGQGEAEAIALAIENKENIILDDKQAIKVCKMLNVQFTTALNILVALYDSNILAKEQAELALKKLSVFGRYSQELINKAKEGIQL